MKILNILSAVFAVCIVAIYGLSFQYGYVKNYEIAINTKGEFVSGIYNKDKTFVFTKTTDRNYVHKDFFAETTVHVEEDSLYTQRGSGSYMITTKQILEIYEHYEYSSFSLNKFEKDMILKAKKFIKDPKNKFNFRHTDSDKAVSDYLTKNNPVGAIIYFNTYSFRDDFIYEKG